MRIFYLKNDEFSLNENDIEFPIQNQNKQKIIILLPCIVCVIIVLTVMIMHNMTVTCLEYYSRVLCRRKENSEVDY